MRESWYLIIYWLHVKAIAYINVYKTVFYISMFKGWKCVHGMEGQKITRLKFKGVVHVWGTCEAGQLARLILCGVQKCAGQDRMICIPPDQLSMYNYNILRTCIIMYNYTYIIYVKQVLMWIVGDLLSILTGKQEKTSNYYHIFQESWYYYVITAYFVG